MILIKEKFLDIVYFYDFEKKTTSGKNISSNSNVYYYRFNTFTIKRSTMNYISKYYL